MTEVFIIVGIAILLGVILGQVEVYYYNKKKRMKEKQKCFDPNDTNFISRFETDSWELRTGRHYN